jgi:hypothetical protein
MASTWGVDGLDRGQGGAEVAHLGEQAVQLGPIGNWARQGGGAVVLDLRVAAVARAASAWPRRRVGWCGHESYRWPIRVLPSRLDDPGSGDKLRAPSRREQLGGENRGRHHYRMIEGPETG